MDGFFISKDPIDGKNKFHNIHSKLGYNLYNKNRIQLYLIMVIDLDYYKNDQNSNAHHIYNKIDNHNDKSNDWNLQTDLSMSDLHLLHCR